MDEEEYRKPQPGIHWGGGARLSELGLAQSEITFRQQIQHKRTVTSGTVTINCWYKACLLRKHRGSFRGWLSRWTSGYFTTRIEGRRRESWRPKKRLSYSHLSEVGHVPLDVRND
jgi:hypothetical protein